MRHGAKAAALVANATDMLRFRPAFPSRRWRRAAGRRRDPAVEGFLRIARRVDDGDTGPLRRFHDDAVTLVRPAVAGWRQKWKATVEHEARITAGVLDALERGDGEDLRRAELLESPPSLAAGWGMCGRLRTHDFV